MDWRNRVPDDVSDVEYTAEGFQAKLDLPVDPDGFFGRSCPSCDRFFKMRADQWSALPDEVKITCPYCGQVPDDISDFLTEDQLAYAQEALVEMARQYAFDQVRNMMKGLQRSTPPGSAVRITVNETPPPRGSLQRYVEDTVRRTIECEGCKTIYAVYGATAFCPVCGPRPAATTVIEAIRRGETALALEDALPEDLREQSRADGVFDKAAEDVVKEVVTLFEVFGKDQFAARVADAGAVTKGLGNVFQRLDDADALFGAHAGFTISSLVDPATWDQLQIVFQQRHVLIHNRGIIDQKYVDRVPGTRQAVGQRLTISRADAEAALAALEAIVQAVVAK